MGPLQNLLELICPWLTYDAYKVAQYAGDLVRLLGVEGLFAYKVFAFRRDLVHTISHSARFHSDGVIPVAVLKLRKNDLSLLNPDSSATSASRLSGLSLINCWA